MKRTWMFLLVAFLLLFCGCGTVKPASAGERQTYGVFLGRNGDEMEGLERFGTIVIEPEEYAGADRGAQTGGLHGLRVPEHRHGGGISGILWALRALGAGRL